MFRLVLVLAILLSSAAYSQDMPLRISAPISYEKTMLVLVNDDGAAAVRFRATAAGAAVYDFRYESKDGKSASEDNKPLIEIPGPAGIGGELFINAGPMSLEWSMGDENSGWIYYRPEEVSVFLANAQDFLDRPAPAPGGERISIPKLDLKRFMRK